MSFSNIRKVDPNTITFTLAPLTVSYANTLRRIMLTGVEAAGFRSSIDAKGRTGDVVVEVNDTPLTNEMLAHRIGMLPVHVKDPLAFQSKADKYQFILNVKNDSDRPKDVCAGDFEVFEMPTVEGDEPVRIATNTFFPANPITGDTCLIAVLKGKQFGQAKGESISLKAKASVSTGRENAAFIPVSQCSYVYTPNSNPDRLKEVFEDWLRKSKKLSPEDIQEDQARRVALEKEFNTMEVGRCFLEDERGEPYSYDFIVESIGVLDPAYIVRRACEVAEAMCMRYANVETGEFPEDLAMQRTTMMMPGYDFMFKGHDHTLGNMLQTFLVENHVDGETTVNYAGYCVPHPLTDVMKLTVGVMDNQESSARKAVAEAARGCAEIFRGLRNQWLEATSRA